MRSVGMLQLYAPTHGGLKTEPQPTVGNASRRGASNDVLMEPSKQDSMQVQEMLVEKSSPSEQVSTRTEQQSGRREEGSGEPDQGIGEQRPQRCGEEIGSEGTGIVKKGTRTR